MYKKIALITGASSGIGAEFVRQTHRRNDFDELWLIARREEELKKIANQLTNIKGRVFSVDLLNEENIKEFVKTLKKEKPSIKLLVNSAGMGQVGFFQELDIGKQLKEIDLNIRSLVELTYHSLRYMNEGSQIINIASVQAFYPFSIFNIYAASKAFVLRFSLALHKELKKRKISVTCVCPGLVRTNFWNEMSGGKKDTPEFFTTTTNKVVSKALKDAQKSKKISIYGFFAKFQRIVASLGFSNIFIDNAVAKKTCLIKKQ
ncbi:SDR family NAD(P)-dependent oxidoreductase [Chlamydiota bacterium]